MKWTKVVLLVLVLALSLGLVAGCGGNGDGGSASNGSGGDQPKDNEPAKKETIRLTIGSGHPETGLTYTITANTFFQPEVEKRVAERTNYEIKWTEAYAGSVAKLEGVLEAVEDGLLDIGVMSFPFEPQKLYLENFPYYIPFQTPDPVQAVKISRKVMEEVPEWEAIFEKYNQKFLGLGPTGPYELLTTFPVDEVADLKGKKIAAAGPNLTLLEGTGAVPVQSNLNEAYTSFQTGVYDGWIMFALPSKNFKLYEVAKYHTRVGFGAEPVQGITINLDTWNNLPKEVQDIISEVAAEYEVKAAQDAKDNNTIAEEFMAQNGVTVTDLPMAEKQKWAAGLPNVPDRTAKEIDSVGLPGSKAFKLYLQYLEEDGYQLPRKWEIK